MINTLTFKNKKKKSRGFIRRKLKKKWRFWRMFKFFFLRRKKKFFFPKIRWLFSQKRIIWHQLSTMYGKNIKNRAYNNFKSKIIFNTKFAFVLSKLELRLNILLLRMSFVNKLLQANVVILKKKIKINSIIKHQNYLVSIGDLINYIPIDICFKNDIRRNKLKWYRFKWVKWKKIVKKKKKFNRIFFSLKKNFVFNYVEINYIFFSAILLKYPLLGEISYRNKKRLLVTSLLKKIYFLY